MKLLLIDDNPLVRASLGGLLRDLYPELGIVEAASCEMAGTLRGEDFTHVLVDFHLSPFGESAFMVCEPGPPVLQGWACLEALARCFPQARLILMSARPRAEMIGPAQAMGASDFVEKSVWAARMLSDLKRAIHG